ncbi:MAG: PqqD family protein [Candidatus Omnitrophota bacterium]
MSTKVNLDKIYNISDEDVVAREVAGEFLIIPITSGVGDIEDEIYTLNATGKAIWDKIDGKKTLKELASELAAEFEGTSEDIERDVTGITEELLKRNIISEKK